MVFHNWKDSFELPHESNWGLYQKKCFLNGYSTKELTYSRSSTNDAKNFSISENLSSELRYCPVCAKYGYHAWFHQLQFLDKCLIHTDQALIHSTFSPHATQEKSFFETIQTRVIDTIKNEVLCQEIEKQIQFDFDCICVIDPMDYYWGAQRTFRPRWYNSTNQTLKEYFTHEVFSASRKVAVLTPGIEKEVCRKAEEYLEQCALPLHVTRMQTIYPDEDKIEAFEQYAQFGKKEWYNARATGPIHAHVRLVLHKHFYMLYHQVGGETQFEAILESIHRREYDIDLCDYVTYAKVIALILSSHYYTVSQMDLLYCDVRRLIKISDYSSKLDLANIDFNECIEKKPLDRHMKLLIIDAILADLFSHTTEILADLMAEKRCLTGGDTSNIYSSFFCLPISQYIAICKNGTVELWACDPEVDGLIKNIHHSLEYHKEHGYLESYPNLEPV